MNKLGEVWDYLTNMHGHPALWLLIRPLLPQHKISRVTSRYSYRPIIVTRSGRTLAVLDLLTGQWKFTGFTPKALPSDASPSAPVDGKELNASNIHQHRLFSEFDETPDLR
ncbi:hypothetical protein [Serratia plymuthica]|uniref:hypothetical protein n=1 Tax=Serratia plymuthica TaxID=82996 RepID=UPI00141A118E|nr:hypothetical protein [Serratia plymuthica]NIC29269.1 hypothetical protein [Serratia plymuthica]QPS87881.1 hypothetical protein I6G46_02580 [Serratia plymuthica]